MHMFGVIGVLVLIVATGSCTPTDPIRPNVSSLPVFYLVNSTNGSLTVLNTKPSYDVLVLAKARYNGSCGDFGWDYCHVQTDDDSHEGFYAAGYLEGWVGSDSLAMNNWNSVPPPKANAWVDEHIAFLQLESAKYMFTDAFWSQVGKLLRQMEGIADGYSAKTGAMITFKDVFLQNFGNEIGDVVTATQVQSGETVRRNVTELAASQHCSALIKITDDDMFVAHDTWSGFGGLGIRVYKTYDFGGKKVSMDSFPGVIASGTDWYITSQELAVQETTNIVFNTSLYKAVIPQSVSEFLRVMTANYLSVSGDQWTYYFARLNSGTYNNQYMVVDYKKFSPGSTPQDGLLWVAEQVPGQVVRSDETTVLRATSYWASYNINYFESLYVLSGYEEAYQEQGTFWSYSKYARPEIFRRNQTQIFGVDDMQRMMRYNNYAVDEYSIIPNCTGAAAGCNTRHTSMLTIASRGDLMTVYNTTAENVAVYGPLYSWVAQGCFGAIDSKIASYKTRLEMRGLVINGPTNDQQPTFSWGENELCPSSARPAGSPETYDFPWVEFFPSDF